MTVRAEQPVSILILLTANFNIATTMAFIDPFRVANYLAGRSRYKWSIASAQGGPCTASNNCQIDTLPLDAVRSGAWDFIVVSSSWTPEGHSTPRMQSFLWAGYNAGAVIAGLDTGGFLLARAGLLKGKRATVHYEHLDAFQELFPEVSASEDIYVCDGRLMTCCGGVASTDFALGLIRRAHGEALAGDVARYLFKPDVRGPDAPQSTDRIAPFGQPAPAKVREAIRCMEANLEDPVALPDLCRKIGISQRHLNRLFSQTVGKTPTHYYRDIRLDRARGLITQTDLSLAQVAMASGFSNLVHFGRAYRNRFGLPPSRDRVEGRVPFEFRAWPMHRKPE